MKVRTRPGISSLNYQFFFGFGRLHILDLMVRQGAHTSYLRTLSTNVLAILLSGGPRLGHFAQASRLLYNKKPARQHSLRCTPRNGLPGTRGFQCGADHCSATAYRWKAISRTFLVQAGHSARGGGRTPLAGRIFGIMTLCRRGAGLDSPRKPPFMMALQSRTVRHDACHVVPRLPWELVFNRNELFHRRVLGSGLIR